MFGKLIQDLKGVGSTFNKLLGQRDDTRYPSAGADLITNSPEYTSGAWKDSKGYEFSVVKFDKNSSTILGDADGWSPFRLQINPQELSIDELFAIQVTPTFRGVLVEHQGVTIKDITISGTTGLSPNRREGGALSNDGSPVFQLGTSGFEEFHELRSYFRVYVEQKRKEAKGEASEIRMVFSNFKDNEYLFIEPQKFSMKRNAAKPMLYDYTISAKAIGVAIPPVASADFGIFSQIDNVLEKANEYTALAVQTINASFAIISRFQRNLQSAILDPLQNINRAIGAIRGGSNMNFGNFGITKRTMQSLKNELESIEANFNDIIGKKSEAHNKATGRVTTLQAATGRQPTFQELQIANGIQAGKKACVILMSKLELFEPDIFTSNAQVLALFPNANIENPNSVTTSTIGGGDNIQTIALRELGDVDKFKDIVILNNLKPPYISESGGPGVLKPGQKILIPSRRAAQESSVVKSQRYNITKDMQQAEIDLGVDIRLNDDGDIAFSNTKDLDLVGGVDNMIQAIGIKLLMEKGGLKRHPAIGVNLHIGSKTRSGTLTQIRRDIIASLTSDARIQAIPYIELRQEGGTVEVMAVVKLKEIDQPVPLPLTLNIG